MMMDHDGKDHPYLDGVIRNQEVFFPPHEDVVCLVQLVVVEGVRVEGFCILVECQELAL